MTKSAAVLLLSLSMFAGCRPEQRAAELEQLPVDMSGIAGDGRRFQDALCDLIRRSDQIIVTEHSFQTDPAPVPELVYSRVVLTKPQREAFLAEMKSLNPRTKSSFDLCISQPHHRFEFFAAGKPTGSIEVCFLCDIITWEDQKATEPEALYAGLAEFLSSIGMQATRDWRQMVVDRAESNRLRKSMGLPPRT